MENARDQSRRREGGALFYGILALVFGLTLAQWLGTLFFNVGVPCLLLLTFTCPSVDSFQAKKELKRVYRGQHLPDKHPDKPKSWLAKAAARVGASVGVEIFAAGGFETTFSPVVIWASVPPVCLARFANVKINATGESFVWIGIVNKWYFLRVVEPPKDS